MGWIEQAEEKKNRITSILKKARENNYAICNITQVLDDGQLSSFSERGSLSLYSNGGILGEIYLSREIIWLLLPTIVELLEQEQVNLKELCEEITGAE